MTAAIALGLVGVVAALVGLVAWLVVRTVGAIRQHADERVAHTATNGKLERERFELEETKAALVEARRVTDGLEDVLASYINSAPNSDLARGDVLGRLVRAAQRQAQAGGDSAAGAAAGETVPAESAAVGTEGAIVPADRDALMQP